MLDKHTETYNIQGIYCMKKETLKIKGNYLTLLLDYHSVFAIQSNQGHLFRQVLRQQVKEGIEP